MAKTKIDSVTLTGQSGRAYDFRIYVWDTKFRAVPAVYVVAARSVDPGQSARYEPLFVGHTDDVSKVLKAHPRNDCFLLHYANVIGVHKVVDAAARDAIVTDLTGGLAPPCNAPDAD